MTDDLIKLDNEKQLQQQNDESGMNQIEEYEEDDIVEDMEFASTFQFQSEMEISIDLWNTIIDGNFDIIYGYESIIDYDSYGPQGFGIVHYLATQGQLEGLKLLKQRGANLDLLTKQKQNALAIACNYGFVDIAKYLIDQGCQIDNVNLFNMSPLTYAIKNKKYSIIFYLLIKSQFQNLSDKEGNSFVHYSAMENDVFMLQFYDAFQLEYNVQNNQGQTPLAKAIQNYALNSVKYLLKTNPTLTKYKIDQDVVNSNEKIKYLIRQVKIQKILQQNQNLQKIQKIILTYKKCIVIVILSLFFLFELIFFITSDVHKTLMERFLGSIFDISFIIGIFYQTLYVIWFMQRTTDNQNQGTQLIQIKLPYQCIQNRYTKYNNVTIQKTKSNLKEKQPVQIKLYNILKKIYINQLIPFLSKIQINFGQTLGNENEEKEQLINEQGKVENIYEKQKILQNKKKDIQDNLNLYEIGRIPSFLEEITLKDFLQINYQAVEDLIDQMHPKPAYDYVFMKRINQSKEDINKLLENNDPLWYNRFTILHIVYFLFETNRLKLIQRMDWNRICFTCLQFKPPRTYHCQSCNMCVKDYHLHSKFLVKCINSTNHLFYFLFVFQFTIFIDFYLLFNFWHYYDKLNCIVIMMPNLFFLIDQSSRLQSIIFIINVVISFVLNFELLVEIICILNNMTRNELFNSNSYKYLYFPVNLSNGETKMTYIQRLKNGISINLFNFIKYSFSNLKLL